MLKLYLSCKNNYKDEQTMRQYCMKLAYLFAISIKFTMDHKTEPVDASSILYKIINSTKDIAQDYDNVQKYNSLPDNVKNSKDNAWNLYRELVYSRADLISHISNKSNDSLSDMVMRVMHEVMNDDYLSTLNDSVTTHQIMSHYIQKIAEKGYVGIITAENDKDEETDSRVFTNYAIGIWDVSALDQLSIIPMKVKFLRKIIKQVGDEKIDPITKIDKYVQLYKNMTKQN